MVCILSQAGNRLTRLGELRPRRKTFAATAWLNFMPMSFINTIKHKFAAPHHFFQKKRRPQAKPKRAGFQRGGAAQPPPKKSH
jgi:hypothetical protein